MDGWLQGADDQFYKSGQLLTEKFQVGVCVVCTPRVVIVPGRCVGPREVSGVSLCTGGGFGCCRHGVLGTCRVVACAGLQEASTAAGVPATVRFQAGYDHSYYFISTFIDEHIEHHARYLA